MATRYAVVELDTTGSTQDEARDRFKGPQPILVVSRHQTSGRGRLGRVWEDPDRALLASLVLSQGSTKRPPGSLWPADTKSREIDTLGVLSLLASIASLIGFASSTCLQWRTDKRETREAALEWQRKELEIEKLRLELGKI